MAIRIIREEGDDILRKKCREVTDFNDKLHILIDDMIETMHDAGGVGLAAPQVGILKRIVVIDTRGVKDDEEGQLLELVNPVMVYKHDDYEVAEGCLSVPGVRGVVVRPKKAIVRAQDRYGKVHEYKGTGLLAQAMCHECDHLEGILFVDKVVRYLDDNE